MSTRPSLWCSSQGLYGKELVAVDGTKIRADNSGKNVYSRTSTKKRIERMEKRIDDYLREPEKNDREDTEESTLSKEATIDVRLNDEKNREKLRRRREIVEHPFGTVKHGWGYRQFLCRGLLKTSGEQSLAFLAYNLRRVFNIFKVNQKNMLQVIGV